MYKLPGRPLPIDIYIVNGVPCTLEFNWFKQGDYHRFEWAYVPLEVCDAADKSMETETAPQDRAEAQA